MFRTYFFCWAPKVGFWFFHLYSFFFFSSITFQFLSNKKKFWHDSFWSLELNVKRSKVRNVSWNWNKNNIWTLPLFFAWILGVLCRIFSIKISHHGRRKRKSFILVFAQYRIVELFEFLIDFLYLSWHVFLKLKIFFLFSSFFPL